MTGQARRDVLRLMETFRSLFYTPIYVAVAGGFLLREGLDTFFSTLPAGQAGVDVLRRGEADVLQTGVSRSLMALDQGHQDAPVHIAEINQRDGFFLVSRRPAEGWQWKALEGATLVPVGFTPVPWTTLKAALARHDVNLAQVRLAQGLPLREALELFRGGGADYIHLPHPQAQQLVSDDQGHIVAAIGPGLGHLCYSSFAVTPGLLERRQEVLQRFVNGFHRGQQWLAAAAPGAVAALVAPFFPSVALPVLEASIARYKAQDTWATSPLIQEDGYNAMRDILIEGGLVRGRHSYERVVRPELALKAMSA